MDKIETHHVAINELLASRIEAGDFPSAAYLVAERGCVRYSAALGRAVVEPREVPATFDTIYDLASLTKPLVTGLLCALRVERGELELDAPAADYLSEFGSDAHKRITVRQLLTHTAGLPAWRSLRSLTGDRSERVAEVIARLQLEHVPGARVVYSDLGFIMLGLLLERLGGAPLAELARREIFQPLLLRRTCFNPAHSLRAEIAASEINGNDYERTMFRAGAGADEADSPTWREQIIWGEVHDGNAHFLGGAAGHAGLFSDPRETCLIAEQFISARTRLLKPDTCHLFHTNMTEGLNEARSLAWQLAATPDSTAGGALSADTFGHLGFTGTSCWIDSRNERVFLLLTNRTHTRRLPFVNINSVRRRFHTLAAKTLDNAERAGIPVGSIEGTDTGG